MNNGKTEVTYMINGKQVKAVWDINYANRKTLQKSLKNIGAKNITFNPYREYIH